MLDPPIELGMLNIIRDTELASKYGVTRTPTLIWFENGKSTTYTGSYTDWTTGDELARWVQDGGLSSMRVAEKEEMTEPVLFLNDGASSLLKGATVAMSSFALMANAI